MASALDSMLSSPKVKVKVTQCKGDISHAFKTGKIVVFNPMTSRSPDVPLQDELLTLIT